MIKNLGKAVSILARAEALEIALHEDVAAWGAPSECHGAVSRGEAQRRRQARRHAEAVARRPLRIIEREAKARGGVGLHEHSRAFCRAMEPHLAHLPY